MRRSVVVFGTVGFMSAMLAAVLGLWLPARQQDRDAAWKRAGEQALARVSLPAAYSAVASNSRIRVCANGPDERCFLGPGAPAQQVATLKTALGTVATGAMQVSCSAVPLPGSPASCHLGVPVTGSRLLVDVFAHPRNRSEPVDRWTYAGTYVLIHVDSR